MQLTSRKFCGRNLCRGGPPGPPHRSQSTEWATQFAQIWICYHCDPTFGEVLMVRRIVLILVLSIAGSAAAQSAWLQDLPNPHDYILKRSSSYDRTGGNADARPLAPGSALTVLDEAGPG